MYLAHFGLRKRPFELTPDPRFLFFSSVHQEAFAALKYGIWQRRGIIRLVGDVGTGKSTLVRALMEELDVSVKTVWINHTTVNPTEFLKLVVQELDLEPKSENRLDLLTQVQLFLLEEARCGRPSPVFLIDEAQNLSDEVLEEIRLLSNLETDERKLAQIVLSGQPEFEQRLERPDLRNLAQRIAVRAWLSPLAPEETAEYIRHRLQIAGNQDPYLFSPEAFRAIWENTGGLPRLINLLCEQTLIYAFGDGKTTIDGVLVNSAALDMKLSLAGSEEAKRGNEAIETDEPTLVPVPESRVFDKNPVPRTSEDIVRRQSFAIFILYALVFVASLYIPWSPTAGFMPKILQGVLAIGLVVIPFGFRLIPPPFQLRRRSDPWVRGATLRIMNDSQTEKMRPSS